MPRASKAAKSNASSAGTKSAPGAGGLSVQPGHLVRRLHQISVAVFLRETEEYNLTQIQYATLETVEATPGLDQVTLANEVALDRQTASYVVRRLAERGLLLRKQKDGRTNQLYLTPAAKALIASMKQHTKAVGDILLAPLTKAERATFMGMLTKLVDTNNELSRAPYRPREAE